MSSLANLNLQFHIVENSPFLTPVTETRSRCFDFWKNQWPPIYKKLGSAKVPRVEDFLLFDLITCVESDSEILAITGHRFFNMKDPICLESEYVTGMGQEFVDVLDTQGLTNVMTFESLLVLPQMRKKECNPSLSRTLAYLINRLYSASRFDAIIAAARSDLKVGELARSVGYETVKHCESFRVFECDLIYQHSRDLLHPEDEAWQLSEKLWVQRRLHSGEQLANLFGKSEKKRKNLYLGRAV